MSVARLVVRAGLLCAVFILAGTPAAWGFVGYRVETITGFTPESLNNHGEVVGTGKFSNSAVIPQGFYWSARTGSVRLPMYNATHAYHTYSHDINDAGLVAGNRRHGRRVGHCRSGRCGQLPGSPANRFAGGDRADH